MATIGELVARGILVRIDPVLDDDEQPVRLIYASRAVADWIEEKLPQLESFRKIQLSPAEQLDALFHDFCAGLSLHYDKQFKDMRPKGDGIWELKTIDCRVFGWFALKDVFIAAFADGKFRLETYKGLQSGYVNETKRFREKLDLNEPKCVYGANPSDVISNCPIAR